MGHIGILETPETVATPVLLAVPAGQAWASLALAQLADRLRTGCVYERQPADTFGVLVTRDDPRSRWRARRVLAPIDAHWPALAPSVALLTGHTAACGARRCRGTGRCAGQVRSHLGWEAFAAAYRAELDQRDLPTCWWVVRQIVGWLRVYGTVTLLSFESGMPKSAEQGEARAAWEQGTEAVPWAQRHIFRDWLLGLPPIRVRSFARRGAVVAGAMT